MCGREITWICAEKRVDVQWVHIPSYYFCQPGQLNNRTSAETSIVSRQTTKQIQVMTHSRQREKHSFFSGAWCLLFHGIFSRKLHRTPGGGETEETTCLYQPQCRKWQSSIFVWAKQQPGAVVEESLCVFVFLEDILWKAFIMSDSPENEGAVRAVSNCKWPTGLGTQLS